MDDLAIYMKDPQAFCATLKEQYKLKLKGVGPISYHLGCSYTRDEDGTLVPDPRKYVGKIFESYIQMFGEKTKNEVSPPIIFQIISSHKVLWRMLGCILPNLQILVLQQCIAFPL